MAAARKGGEAVFFCWCIGERRRFGLYISPMLLLEPLGKGYGMLRMNGLAGIFGKNRDFSCERVVWFSNWGDLAIW